MRLEKEVIPEWTQQDRPSPSRVGDAGIRERRVRMEAGVGFEPSDP